MFSSRQKNTLPESQKTFDTLNGTSFWKDLWKTILAKNFIQLLHFGSNFRGLWRRSVIYCTWFQAQITFLRIVVRTDFRFAVNRLHIGNQLFQLEARDQICNILNKKNAHTSSTVELILNSRWSLWNIINDTLNLWTGQRYKNNADSGKKLYWLGELKMCWCGQRGG